MLPQTLSSSIHASIYGAQSIISAVAINASMTNGAAFSLRYFLPPDSMIDWLYIDLCSVD